MALDFRRRETFLRELCWVAFALSACQGRSSGNDSDAAPTGSGGAAGSSAPASSGGRIASSGGASAGGATNAGSGGAMMGGSPANSGGAMAGGRSASSGGAPGAGGDRETGGSSADAGTDVDPFGVQKLYPTIAGGREWYLPANAEVPSEEWNVETNPVSKVSAGVFHTSGNNGELRLTVSSPAGKAWWRNVEMTGYFRYTGPMDSNGQERHWELLARCERHSENATTAAKINGGASAPPGTATWPGYPFGSGSVNSHCLGSSYHGNVYVDGYAWFEKEITHTAGYAPERGRTNTPGIQNPLDRWFGYKFVLRNASGDARVHLELWLDARGDGTWERVNQFDDSSGTWAAQGDLDGCDSAPFGYRADQLITWAGPWITFRSDSIVMDFRWLSAREIGPLP